MYVPAFEALPVMLPFVSPMERLNPVDGAIVRENVCDPPPVAVTVRVISSPTATDTSLPALTLIVGQVTITWINPVPLLSCWSVAVTVAV